MHDDETCFSKSPQKISPADRDRIASALAIVTESGFQEIAERVAEENSGIELHLAQIYMKLEVATLLEALDVVEVAAG